MKKSLMAIIVLCFFCSGLIDFNANAIDIYTFKKKRVDQELKGNRGYIMGTPPAPVPRKDKRTIIGIDIELPGVIDDGEVAEGEGGVSVQSKDIKHKPVTVVSDEDWIK